MNTSDSTPWLHLPGGWRGAARVVIGTTVPALLGVAVLWACMRYGTHPVVVTP